MPKDSDALKNAQTQAHSHLDAAQERRRHFLKVASLAAGAIAFAPLLMAQPYAETSSKRTILITGSTSGMGRRLAERLAGPTTTVLIHGRSRIRGEEAVAAIRNAGGDARFYAADFASLAEVRGLAEAVLRDHTRLDLLVNNAGIYLGQPETRQLSRDGHELRFAINYLAPVALTQRLIPLLKTSRPARIINVASSGQNAIDFDDVMLARGYSHQRAYGQSKLALIMYTIDLARELQGSGVTANAVHPANYMDTPMVRDAGIRPWSSVDEGSNAVLHLANAVALQDRTGLYFSGQSESRASTQAYDEQARARLRTLTAQLTDT